MTHLTYKGVKALAVFDDHFIGAKGYNLYKFGFDGDTRGEKIGTVSDWKTSLFSKFRLTSRFLRAEINRLYTLKDGAMLVIARKGIFRCESGQKVFRKCFAITRGSRPLNLCVTPDGAIFFGEYFANMGKSAVHIYGSYDSGRSWQIVYTFGEGNINHIHGLFYDKYAERIWVATGDRENECIIGYTEDNFDTFCEVFRGGQEYRTCNLFFYPTHILFATDSQYVTNSIKRFDRNTLEISTLQQLQGSVIKGTQCGDAALISTTIEPSDVNIDKFSHLWYSPDGESWKDIYKAEKDCLPSIFQFGSIEFPQYYIQHMQMIISNGRALKQIDGSTILIKL